MTTVFADRFYYIALLNPDDEAHQRASLLTAGFGHRIVTTAWVLTELANSLCSLKRRGVVARFLLAMSRDRDIRIVPPTRRLFERGIERFANRPDKEWSLTDCISFIVMEDQGIRDALTADHHFEQAGFRALLRK